MAEPTLAEILFTAAEHDHQAFAKLAEDPALHDSLCGFHAQQAVEKALKAVLAHARVVFRRTHDIAELLDRLEDAGIKAPPHAAHLDELNPYAIEMRYGLVGVSNLDRAETADWLQDVMRWSHAYLQSGTDRPAP
jgi:HEPN domain-containing protein